MNIFSKALHIKRTLGTRCAAGFLRNRGVSLQVALSVLVYQAITPRSYQC